jgi:hypothetical protein
LSENEGFADCGPIAPGHEFGKTDFTALPVAKYEKEFFQSAERIRRGKYCLSGISSTAMLDRAARVLKFRIDPNLKHSKRVIFDTFSDC